MTTTTYLLSSLITGVVLLGVAAYVARAFAWKRLASRVPATVGGGSGAAAELPGEAGTSQLPLGVAAAAVVVVAGGVGVALAPETLVLGGIVGLFAGLLALYVTWGTYHICRARGMTYAQAVGAGVWLLAMVFVVGVVAKLLVAG